MPSHNIASEVDLAVCQLLTRMQEERTEVTDGAIIIGLCQVIGRLTAFASDGHYDTVIDNVEAIIRRNLKVQLEKEMQNAQGYSKQ